MWFILLDSMLFLLYDCSYILLDSILFYFFCMIAVIFCLIAFHDISSVWLQLFISGLRLRWACGGWCPTHISSLTCIACILQSFTVYCLSWCFICFCLSLTWSPRNLTSFDKEVMIRTLGWNLCMITSRSSLFQTSTIGWILGMTTVGLDSLPQLSLFSLLIPKQIKIQ